MTVYVIDPLQDPRWGEFLQRHPAASVFHSIGWLEALRRTYGYTPIVLSTSAPEQDLKNGLAFCYINSRLTGRRLVSLPFSDHCEPLLNSPEDLEELLAYLVREHKNGKWKYLEIRPFGSLWNTQTAFQKAQIFYFHSLSLSPSIDELFRNFHRDSIQRKIRRSEREALIYEEGRSEILLNKFYDLLLKTRRRQRLVPQPLGWFRNLIDCLAGQLSIRVASKGGRHIAGILTLRYKNSLIYKYGCSDSTWNNLGGMHFLLWETIREAKREGLREIDLGRSDCDNPGLVTFKDRWGAARSTLTYLRYPGPRAANHGAWQSPFARQILACMPDCLLATAGKLLYRHAG